MFDTDLSTLDADALLTAAACNDRAAMAAEARRLEIAAAWADLHGALDGPERSAALPGVERLVMLGGEGTPAVAEFCPAELGAVQAMSPHSATALISDALDLRHRLPRLWSRVRATEVKPWVARRIAQTCRAASLEAAAAVDRRVAPFAHSLPVGRLERVAQAAMIESDPAAAQSAADLAESSQGVWLSRSTDHGTREIFIRTDAASAMWFDASIDRVADGLSMLGDADDKDARRGKAVGVLAQPQAALDLFDRAAVTAGGGSAASDRAVSSPPGVDPRPPATLYVHVSSDLAAGAPSVARVEGIGPVVEGQVRAWLNRCDVTVKPVIDLPGLAPVDAYEIPDKMREAVFLRSPADVFPYATRVARQMDVDHTDPYQDPGTGGPPGQTRLPNLGPHTRFHHRLKTHGRWAVRQIADGAFLWRSPHGRHFLVDQAGTAVVDEVTA